MNESAESPTQGSREQARVISAPSAVGICIASMIGAGIFTVTGTIGFELVTTPNLMIGWVIGGLVALCGGFAVAELAAMRPRASAQYEVVHEALGPSFGFLKGMITLLIGYISSLAAVAMVAGGYIENVFPAVEPRLVATLLLVGLSVVHAPTVIGGQRFNDLLVAFKIALVLGFVVLLLLLFDEHRFVLAQGLDERLPHGRGRFASVPLSQCGRTAQRSTLDTYVIESFRAIVEASFPKSCFQQRRALRRGPQGARPSPSVGLRRFLGEGRRQWLSIFSTRIAAGQRFRRAQSRSVGQSL